MDSSQKYSLKTQVKPNQAEKIKTSFHQFFSNRFFYIECNLKKFRALGNAGAHSSSKRAEGTDKKMFMEKQENNR